MKHQKKWLLLFLALSLFVITACSERATAATLKSSASALRIQTPEESGTAVIAYVHEDNLWVVDLLFQNGSPTVQAYTQATANGGVTWAKISADGRQIAYLRETADGTSNALHTIQLATLADSKLVDSANLNGFIDIVEWLPDNTVLAFNTHQLDAEGRSTSNEDLWVVDSLASPLNPFPAGTGGGSFAIAPDFSNSVLFVRQVNNTDSELYRGNLFTNQQEPLFTFKTIVEEDEVTYPQPNWTADDNLAFVPIPEKSDDISWSTTALWRIPVEGTAQLLAMLPGRTDGNQIAWSTEGERIAYVQAVTERNHELFVSTGNVVESYEGSGNISILDWHQNGEHFLYTRNNVISIGRQTEEPVKIPVQMVNEIASGQWIDGKSFMIVSGTEQAWEIGIGSWNGTYESLLIAKSKKPIADVWRQKPPPKPEPTPTPLPTETPLPPTATPTPWPTAVPTEVVPTAVPPTQTPVPPTATPAPQQIAPAPQAPVYGSPLNNPNVRPPITDMPILATYYNPVLGGINCDSDCSRMADNLPWSSADYGKVAACIPGWHYSTVNINGLGSFLCRDKGGAIVVEFNQYYQMWVIHIDILLEREPSWNYYLFYNWWLQ